ncbi:hypothetical protein MHU86_2288 [Fragilaria crotonensis]|nr:hypothetical protein MHU86_2288 [Fragilaria crotonensis]
MSEAKKAGATLESIKVIPFSGTDTTKGGMEPREFFMKAEVFAATKGFKRALLEDRVSPSLAMKAERTDEEEELIRQDDEAKHFLIMSCRGDVRYHRISRNCVRDVSSVEGPLRFQEDEGLGEGNDQVGEVLHEVGFGRSAPLDHGDGATESGGRKCENGTRRSDEQMEATILARLPKRRYESVIASLNGKIGSKDYTHKDFISEIQVHYEMFVEPFKNRQARENQEGRERERQAPGAQHIKRKRRLACVQGKCNKCGKQGHRARECRTNSNNINNGERENAKLKVKCYNCGAWAHREGMSKEGRVRRLLSTTIQRAVLKDIREFKWKPRGDEQAKVKVRREKKKPSTMSWADMCETSDDEDDEDEVEEKIEDVAEDDLEYEESKAQEPEAGEEVIDHKEDKIHYEESKTGESEAAEKVENTEFTNEEQEEPEYRMDKSSQGAEWMWDEQVFATNSRKFMSPVTESGHESWLVDSGATTHVSINTKMMTNLKTATEGEHVRVGNNETMKAIAIGDLTLEQKSSGKKLKLEDVMVVPVLRRI